MDKYKLVPVEPTREMINAGYAAMRKNASGERLLGMTAECGIYKAMLAAAPDSDELTALGARVAELEDVLGNAAITLREIFTDSVQMRVWKNASTQLKEIDAALAKEGE